MKLIFYFLLKPYFNRLKLGEGGLVVFNLFQSIYAYREPKIVAAEFFISLLVICLLYGYNDYIDRYADLHNTKKDQSFVNNLIRNDRAFIFFNCFFSLVSILLIWLFEGPSKLFILLALFLINYL